MLILLVWTLILTTYILTSYMSGKCYFEEMKAILEDTDKRYLLGEMMPDSWRQEEYKEYIESWVHEIKAPITGISLICENGKSKEDFSGGSFRKIVTENQKIENYVDMVLYYARSENVYKDYIIQKTALKEAVFEVLEKNRFLLIENCIRAEVVCEDFAYTDRKWNGACSFRQWAGIKKEELSGIFEKEFTGTNECTHEHSTGMGLYLCKKLCTRLGIGFSASSTYGKSCYN